MAATTSTSDLPPRIQGFDFEDDNDDAHAEEPGCQHCDDAQAVLQPSMSAVAIHLTLSETGEDEKRAALKKRPTGDGRYFVPNDPLEEEEEDDDLEGEDSDPPSLEDGGESTPDAGNTPSPSPPLPINGQGTARKHVNLGELPDQRPSDKTSFGRPSPWVSGPRDLVLGTRLTDHLRSRPTSRPSSTFLESAFGGDKLSPLSRPRRSRSVGQEAFKKLQRVLPSPTNLSFSMLPSFHGAFRSSPTRQDNAHSDDNKDTSNDKPEAPLSLPSWSLRRKAAPRAEVRKTHQRAARSMSNLFSTTFANPIADNVLPQRPELIRESSIASHKSGSVLRRVASDDSLLYHVLSPQSSIEDGQPFQDVHEMVNLRVKAIKESLPSLPNLPSFSSLPSLPKVNPNWRHSLNLSSLTSTFGGESFFAEDSANESTTPRPSPQHGSAQRIPGSSTSLLPAKDPFESALESLTGDVVVLGGYRGSILRYAEPPHQQVWAPVKVGLNLRKVNLEVGLTDEDEENMPNKIRPSGMLKNMGPVDISRKLIRRLKTCENAQNGKLRVWDYGYDWRLSPHRLSAGLCDFLAGLPSNQPGVPPGSRGALVIAHSLGGLITRHAVNQRPELFSGVLYAGVPRRTINILGPLRNGDAVLLNEKLLTAAVNFSIRTSFVFLPEDGAAFVDKVTGERYHVDFYNPEEWVRWKISPCVSTPLKSAPSKPPTSSLASLLPNPLRSRSNSKIEPKGPEGVVEGMDHTIAPQLNTAQNADRDDRSKESSQPGSEERQRYMEYLTRTLARTKQFRAELAHDTSHEARNIYPPMAVLYGKSVPTVYAAQVNGREGITQTDAYSDLLFRAGDGVTLAKQALLPKGYSVVKGGKVVTDRGHITLLGDLPAVGTALAALRRGRMKGIGLGEGKKRGPGDFSTSV